VKARDQQTTISDSDEHNCKNTAINQEGKTVVKTARMIHERKQRRAKLKTLPYRKALTIDNTQRF